MRINSRLAAHPAVSAHPARSSRPDHAPPPPQPPSPSSIPVPKPDVSAAFAASWNSPENSSAGHAFGRHYLALVESDKARHVARMLMAEGEEGGGEGEGDDSRIGGGGEGVGGGNRGGNHRGRKLSITSTAGLLGATYPNGIYYVQLGIGTPPQTFNLDIDTGSNLLWVNCLPCNPCTLSKTLQTNPPFDSAKSTSAKLLQCSNKACINPDRTVKIRNCNVTAKPLSKGSDGGSDGEEDGCMYSVAYGDGSGTSGRLLADVIHLPISGSSRAFKVPITFGCGNSQQGNFYNGLGWTYYQALDGLIGLGRGTLSLLTAVGAYKEFFPIRQVVSHCLGGDGGGGWMTVGDIPIPSLMAFTPLQPDETFYKVTLRKVFVGGVEVAVSPLQYGNVSHGNAIFDSGTTYTIMPPLFVPPLFHLIQTAVGLPRYAFSIGKEGSLCFSSTDELTAEDVRNRFPHINLQFEGRGVFMNVPPHTYTFKAMDEGVEIVCTQVVLGSDTIKAPNSPAFIIGALWMRDFLVVHDQEENRVGWAAMKCT
ncbi:hypothetical protein CLOP_g18852 [Closterium sp. NIES-67]|nr:hypothetical protein CLOP_g18852 [Closterium sp. NIES-67]